jgi:hypothetical protein
MVRLCVCMNLMDFHQIWTAIRSTFVIFNFLPSLLQHGDCTNFHDGSDTGAS